MTEQESYNIPERYIPKIKKIAKELKEKEETLQAELVERYITMKAKYKERPSEANWRLAYFGFSSKYRAILRAKPWSGFFVGETEVKDWIEIIKKSIDNMDENARVKFITESGEYLNPYKNSRNYLDPLENHRYFKAMYGVIGDSKFENPVFSVLEWNGDIATKVPEHALETTYDFRATERKSDKIKRLGGVKATSFQESNLDFGRAKQEELLRTLGPMKPFNKLRDLYDLLGKKKALQEIVLTEAGVRSLGKSKQGYVMTLEAVEDEWVNPVTAFVPEFIPINFGKGSIVLALGTLFRDKSDKLCLNASGVFPTVEGILAPDDE